MRINKPSKNRIKDLKSKIIPYGLAILSIGFVGYLLIGVFNHYASKYLF